MFCAFNPFIRRFALGWVLLATFLLAAPIGLAEQPAFPADVPVVENPAIPPNGLQVVQLEEMWRAGGEDSEVFFGHVFRAVADDQDNVYLLDTQLSEVPVFSPTGEHLKTLSREGEGPGESREPADLTMMPDGTLGIVQRFPAKVVKVTLDGTPAGNMEFGDSAAGGFNSVFTGRLRGDNLMFVAQYATRTEQMQTRTWYVARFDAAGQEVARCWSQDLVIDFSNPVIRETDILNPIVFGSTPGPDGKVYIAPFWDDYSILVYASDGSLDHVVTRPFEARKRVDLETGRIQRVFDFWGSRGGGLLPTEVQPNATAITDLYVDAENRLWVENSRSAEAGPAEAMLTYDIYDAEGRFDRQVALVCDGDPQDDELFRVSDDMVVLIKGSIPALYASMAGGAVEAIEEEEAAEAADMEVVCYRWPQ